MRALRHRTRHRPDAGAVIVLVAMLLAVVFTAAALSIDIATQVNQKQALHDTLDAAVHAGAYELPGSGPATKAAVEASMRQSILENDPTIDPDPIVASAEYYCVTASKWDGASWVPDDYVDGVCKTPTAAGRVCNERLCSTPADIDNPTHRVNTVRIDGDKDVDYSFGPVVGQERGSTGALSSAACKGQCGELGRPIDIVTVVDRTRSMLEGGENHIEYVADALIGERETTGYQNGACIREGIVRWVWFIPIFGCVEWEQVPVAGERTGTGLFDLLLPDRHRVALATINQSDAVGSCRSASALNAGVWVPVGLTNAFGPGSVIHNVIDCLPSNESSFAGAQTDFHGPILAARDTLNNAPEHPSGVEPRKAILFLTDGAANLPGLDPCGAGEAAAQAAKDDGIIVVTIAYRLGADVKCGGLSVFNTLGRMATPRQGRPAPDHCPPGNPELENDDGDFFFCAPEPEHLLPVFQAALASLSEDITLLRLPN